MDPAAADPLPAENVATADRVFPAGARWFRRLDWWAFAVAAAVSFVVYVATLAPGVTLEDSGEMVTAAYYLGVPHPPGYPIWTILGWLFTLLPVGPIAWRVNLMSAVFGALTAGVLALLVSRSGAILLAGLRNRSGAATDRSEGVDPILSAGAGVCVALMFAFSRAFWSQAVIAEVYTLNALFQMLLLLIVALWMYNPDRRRLLYLAGFLFGLSFTNHQTILVLGFGFLAALWFVNRRLFCDVLGLGLFALQAVFLLVAAYRHANSFDYRIPQALGIGLTPVSLAILFAEPRPLREWQTAATALACALLGLAVYGYLPIASVCNPPINWAYPQTVNGFVHSVTRGQYESIKATQDFARFSEQLGHWFKNLIIQFPSIPAAEGRGVAVPYRPPEADAAVYPIAWVLSLPALAVLFTKRLGRIERHWLYVVLIGFYGVSVALVVLFNPSLDIQTQFINRVHFILSHGIYALLMGYGLLLALGFAAARLRLTRSHAWVIAIALLALPIWSIQRHEPECSQRGHTYGREFGVGQLVGSGEPGVYPPPMEENAILFGGTDPGRFVPLYFINSARVRPDVFLITQNALADNTYMAVLRDRFGDKIWIPSQHDTNLAFTQYLDDVRGRGSQGNVDIEIVDSRVSVQGVEGVMKINGILSRRIWEENRDRHAFYIEESYVIQWMYPYLTPHGLILKLNAEPVEKLDPELVANDRRYWDGLEERLLGAASFRRDIVARKTFSKLRSAIGGVYVARGMISEAEHAFGQAIRLFPGSPEANLRLADLYVRIDRYDDALAVIEHFRAEDPLNDRLTEVRQAIQRARELYDEHRELLAAHRRDPDRVEIIIKLAEWDAARNDLDALKKRIDGLLARGDDLPPFALPPLSRFLERLERNPEAAEVLELYRGERPTDTNTYIALARLYGEMRRIDPLIDVLRGYLEISPREAGVRLDLAALLWMRRQDREIVLRELATAVRDGGDQIRQAAAGDERLRELHKDPDFQQLVRGR